MNQFYLYGAGIYSKAILASSLDKPTFILDKYLAGQELDGIEVVSPESEKLNKNIPVFLTILGYPDVKSHLEDLGLNNIIDTYDTFKYFKKSLYFLVNDGEFWRVDSLRNKVNMSAVQKFKAILSDERSQVTLEQLIDFRVMPSFETYPAPEVYDMYFPADIPKVYGSSDDELHILDCGAFDGDTAILYDKYLEGRVASYTAVEPSRNNLKKLKDNLKKCSFGDASYIVAAGLGDKSMASATINEAGSASSLLLEPKETSDEIEIKTLPQIISELSINFNVIKMDIGLPSFH